MTPHPDSPHPERLYTLVARVTHLRIASQALYEALGYVTEDSTEEKWVLTALDKIKRATAKTSREIEKFFDAYPDPPA